MIPKSNVILRDNNIKITQQPTKTYQMDFENERVIGNVEGLEAMKQAIFKILNTERYQYLVYSWNYGSEFQDLFGMPVTYVCPELERRITEALTWDKRIKEVTDFSFDTSQRGTVIASFTVHTIYGDVVTEKAVSI